MKQVDRFSASEVAELPVKNGFRQRGMDMTRLETFTDAAFAFAVTLLVIGGGDSVPANFVELSAAMKQVPAFAASFANIMLFWYAHHVWSRRFGLDDTRSVLLSLLLIFIVLIYVYPLKAVYSGAIEFFSAGYFASYFGLQTVADLRSLFVVFAAGYVSLSLVIALLNAHALGIREQLALSDLEIFDTETERSFWILNASVPLASLVLALTVPPQLIVSAGMIYGAFAFVLPWYRRRRRRLRQAIVGSPAVG